MKFSSIVCTIIAVLAWLPTPVAAGSGAAQHVRGSLSRPAFMRVFGHSLPPYGFVMFCEMNPGECRGRQVSHRRIELNAPRLRELARINRLVNAAIEPVTDKKAYGVNEYWTLPVDKGDCEDYALLKRRMLISRGWPGSALLMTVVRDEKGAGHAILTIRTAQGDFIADNKHDDILAWHEAPYRYVMRQSYLNPKVWMRLDAAGDLGATATGRFGPRTAEPSRRSRKAITSR